MSRLQPAAAQSTESPAKLIAAYQQILARHGANSPQASAFIEQHRHIDDVRDLVSSLERLQHEADAELRGCAVAERRIKSKLTIALTAFFVVGIAILLAIATGFYYTWKYYHRTEQFKDNIVKVATHLYANLQDASEVEKELSKGLAPGDSVPPAGRASEDAKAEFIRLDPSLKRTLEETLNNFIQDVVGQLRDKDRDIQTRAAEAIANMLRSQSSPPAPAVVAGVPDLVHMLEEDGAAVAYYRAAIDALGAIGRPAVPALLAALKTPDRRARADLIYALGKMKEGEAESAVDDIIRLGLNNVDDATQRRAVVALGNIGAKAERAIPELRKILADTHKDPKLREFSIGALKSIGAQDAQTVQQVIAALHEKNLDVRRAAAAALGKIGLKDAGARAQLLKALSDWDDAIRHNAAESLAAVEQPPVPELTELLHSKNALERQGAALALGSIGKDHIGESGDKVLSQLIALVKNDEDVHVQAAAIAALGKLLNPTVDPAVATEVQKALIQAATDEDTALFAEAVRALAGPNVPPEKTLEVLQGKLTSPDSAARARAVQTLGQLGQSSARAASVVAKALNGARDDAAVTVQNAAAANLNAILLKFGKLTKREKGDLPWENQELKGRYFRTYPFTVEPGNLYKIDLVSKAFDSYLYVKTPDGKVVTSDDDSGGNLNSRIYLIPKDRADYQLWVSTYGPGETGAYQLEVRELRTKD